MQLTPAPTSPAARHCERKSDNKSDNKSDAARALFTYDLPQDRIASHPADPREARSCSSTATRI